MKWHLKQCCILKIAWFAVSEVILTLDCFQPAQPTYHWHCVEWVISMCLKNQTSRASNGTLLVLLDPSTVFGKIDHKPLLTRLSNDRPVYSGVSQHSVLDTLLFTMYTSPVSSVSSVPFLIVSHFLQWWCSKHCSDQCHFLILVILFLWSVMVCTQFDMACSTQCQSYFRCAGWEQSSPTTWKLS